MSHSMPRIVDLITTANDKKFDAVARMADAIFNITMREGICTPENLRIYGFSSRQITDLWHFAHALAEVEAKKMPCNEAICFEGALLHA